MLSSHNRAFFMHTLFSVVQFWPEKSNLNILAPGGGGGGGESLRDPTVHSEKDDVLAFGHKWVKI